MSSDAVIEVVGLGKRFQVQRGGDATLKGSVLSLFRRRGMALEQFWALKDVSFSVARGETLGIVGANGAGKSTLLSLLAQTKIPTEGSVAIRGAVSTMLELGAGFHPDLTGRENVYLAGALMGLSRKRMRERFDAIVDFAGLHDFIDQPVKHYSSGMYVRLGFAVATEVDPDILLLDEVLAVGDAAFQRKCLGRMAAFREERKTMLMISHDLETIKAVSDRILFLDQGRVQGLGDPGEVVDRYDEASARATGAAGGREWGTGEVRITGVALCDAQGNESDTYAFGDAMTIKLAWSAKQPVAGPVFGFALVSRHGQVLYGNNTQLEGVSIEGVEGEGGLSATIDRLDLGPGEYFLSVSVHSTDHAVNYHRLDRAFRFEVTGGKSFEGCFLPVSWRVPS